MRMRSVIGAVLVALLVTACGPQGTGAPTSSGGAAGSPRAGGTLTFIVASEPPSFDGHKETSYALLHPFAPFYSLLYRFDPNDLTKIIPDVAAELPQLSADKLTWTIKLRTNVKFHDGQTLTADDVVFSYQVLAWSTYQTFVTSPLWWIAPQWPHWTGGGNVSHIGVERPAGTTEPLRAAGQGRAATHRGGAAARGAAGRADPATRGRRSRRADHETADR